MIFGAWRGQCLHHSVIAGLTRNLRGQAWCSHHPPERKRFNIRMNKSVKKTGWRCRINFRKLQPQATQTVSPSNAEGSRIQKTWPFSSPSWRTPIRHLLEDCAPTEKRTRRTRYFILQHRFCRHVQQQQEVDALRRPVLSSRDESSFRMILINSFLVSSIAVCFNVRNWC